MIESDEQFTALMADWSEALVANDADAIGRFAASDWTFVGETGLFAGSDFLGAVADGSVTHDRMDFDVRAVRVYGDAAVVVARCHNSGTMNGTPFEQEEWTSDVFVRQDGAWRCVLSHLTPARDEAGT